VRFDSEYFYLRFERFDCAPQAGNQSSAANAGYHSGGVRRVFENFPVPCAIVRDEIVIIERVNERSFGACKRKFIECFPGDLVWNRNKFSAERFHALEL